MIVKGITYGLNPVHYLPASIHLSQPVTTATLTPPIIHTYQQQPPLESFQNKTNPIKKKIHPNPKQNKITQPNLTQPSRPVPTTSDTRKKSFSISDVRKFSPAPAITHLPCPMIMIPRLLSSLSINLKRWSCGPETRANLELGVSVGEFIWTCCVVRLSGLQVTCIV